MVSSIQRPAGIGHALSNRLGNMEEFLSIANKRKYPRGSTIIYAGEPADSIFYITQGSVTVFLEDDAGREVILAYLNAGDFFGASAMFDSQRNRAARVKAKVACEVAALSYGEFQELSKKDAGMLYRLAGQLAAQLVKTSRQVGDLAFLDITGRVARILLDLCKEPDAMTHPDGMQIKVTRQEISKLVGCSREMVSRVLKTLEAQGLVSVKGHTMVVFGAR